MISAFAKAGTALMEDTYVKRATKAAEFVRKHLYDKKSGRLLRSCYRRTCAEEDVSQKYFFERSLKLLSDLKEN